MLYHHTLTAFALMTAPLAAQELVVVTDIAPVHSLTAQVMGDVGTPTLLVGANDSPHNFSLRPSQARALQDSTAVFWIGPDLTPWLEGSLAELARNAQSVALLEADGALELAYREGPIFGGGDGGHDGHDHGEAKHDDHDDHGHDEDGHDHAEAKHDDHDHDEAKHDDHKDHDHGEAKHDDHDDHGHDDAKHDDHDDHGHDEAKHDDHGDHGHDDHGHDEAKHDDHDDHGHKEAKHDDHGHEGHNHGAFDPHGWLSPDNASLWLTVIADTLSDAAPEHADTFRANAAAAQAELTKTVAEVTATLAPVKDRGFVVYHDAYQYFEAHFGLNSLGSVAISDASAPSPRRIEELRAHILEDKPACAFSEPQLNTKLMDTVLEGEGVKVAVLDPLAGSVEPGPGLYNALLKNLATSIATCAD